ncbi:methyltransferase domain-containing protein [Agromyces marinus]|uniref:methyltransferase domain-containing protein n=1 Tax=Agromyces marinus TaxID=1389020 RepID=UPI001F29B3D6|nr:methyltransferase domain-containing protein [Agromyces marinus]UIP58564.1 hypothetical protein DSM26151_14420 [Agromyces marinus]
MDDCCPRGQTRYEQVFGDRFARALAKRYRRRGLTSPERRIVDAVVEAGIDGATVLEIGGGIGELQLELLRRGGTSTTNLELSGAYEAVARDLAAAEGLAERTRRIVGVDLASDGSEVDEADHVILHRVVCCYPNAESLLRASAAHARRSLVFSHPPNSWPARASTATVNLMMRLRRQEYRGFIHAPDRMYDVLRRSGLEMRSVERAGPWRVVAAVRG